MEVRCRTALPARTDAAEASASVATRERTPWGRRLRTGDRGHRRHGSVVAGVWSSRGHGVRPIGGLAVGGYARPAPEEDHRPWLTNPSVTTPRRSSHRSPRGGATTAPTRC